MPKINVYLPDDLASAVRDAGIPVSAVCQRALADAVAAADGTIGATGPEQSQPDGEWQPNRFTDRVRKVIDLAIEAAGGNQEAVTSVQLVSALVGQGNNLALAILRSLDIEPEDVLAELKATVSTERQRAGDVTAATLLEVGERAARAAAELGNNFIGCEHVLMGILAGPETDPAVATLKTLGMTATKARDAVRAALGGYTYAQGNLSLSGLSAPVRSILEEIRQRLGRLETTGE
jgi:ATP-dependent Clp protease ATP-binding subunit ClpA